MQAVIPLASMGDIAFLLIIFFMLTASFMREKNVSLDLARSADIDKLKQAHVTVSVDADGMIRLQGVHVTVEELPSAVEAMLGDREDRRVQVTIDKGLLKPDYYPVVEALGRAGATPSSPALTGNSFFREYFGSKPDV
jgi:biopolymer transport protein ExbD